MFTEDLRTIATAAFASDVGTDNFYPQGRIPLHLTFVGGGSGIFLATVPEPSSAVLVGLLVFPALRRRRCA